MLSEVEPTLDKAVAEVGAEGDSKLAPTSHDALVSARPKRSRVGLITVAGFVVAAAPLGGLTFLSTSAPDTSVAGVATTP